MYWKSMQYFTKKKKKGEKSKVGKTNLVLGQKRKAQSHLQVTAFHELHLSKRSCDTREFDLSSTVALRNKVSCYSPSGDINLSRVSLTGALCTLNQRRALTQVCARSQRQMLETKGAACAALLATHTHTTRAHLLMRRRSVCSSSACHTFKTSFFYLTLASNSLKNSWLNLWWRYGVSSPSRLLYQTL